MARVYRLVSGFVALAKAQEPSSTVMKERIRSLAVICSLGRGDYVYKVVPDFTY